MTLLARPRKKKKTVNYDLWPQQMKVLQSPATEILYGGAAGGGKSHLIRVLALLLAFSVPNLNIFLFRRKRADLLRSHMKGPTSFPALLADAIEAGVAEKVKDEIRIFHNKKRQEVSTILFCHCKEESDVENYLSTDMHVILLDEGSEFTESMYRMIRSRARKPKALNLPEWLQDKIPLILIATNPGGSLHEYLYQQFVTAMAPEEVWRTPLGEAGMLRQFIPAKLEDNPSIDYNQYAGQLHGLGEELKRRYLDGDWTVIEGRFFKIFGVQHIIEPFTIPEHWTRYRAIDWGYADHTCCLWFAVSDGCVEDHEPGDLIVYRELYVNEKSVAELAGLIHSYEKQDEDIRFTVLDPSAYGLRSRVIRGPTVADEFRKYGINCRRADNARVLGWQQCLYRFKSNKVRIFNTCTNLVRTIPLLEHSKNDPEDVEEKGAEDHAPDAFRYGCMAKAVATKAPSAIDKRIRDLEEKYASLGMELQEYEREAIREEHEAVSERMG